MTSYLESMVVLLSLTPRFEIHEILEHVIMNLKPSWCSDKATRLVTRGRGFDPGLLQSFGRDFKPRSYVNFPRHSADKDIL